MCEGLKDWSRRDLGDCGRSRSGGSFKPRFRWKTDRLNLFAQKQQVRETQRVGVEVSLDRPSVPDNCVVARDLSLHIVRMWQRRNRACRLRRTPCFSSRPQARSGPIPGRGSQPDIRYVLQIGVRSALRIGVSDATGKHRRLVQGLMRLAKVFGWEGVRGLRIAQSIFA
eukprot:1707645-Rhodomonas_salina.1